jgi:hypothetical protein
MKMHLVIERIYNGNNEVIAHPTEDRAHEIFQFMADAERRKKYPGRLRLVRVTREILASYG